MLQFMMNLNRFTLIGMATIFSIFSSLILLYSLYTVLDVDIRRSEVFIVIIAPFIIAPIVSWWLTKLVMRLKALEKELRLSISKEKHAIYVASIESAQHVTNNLLNQLQLVKFEVDKQVNFNEEVATLFTGMLDEADSLMKQLSSVKNIDVDEIKRSVSPK